MRRVRIGIIGAGPLTEWAILPALSGPDAVAPPDTGSWWSRRPVADSQIRYQAPARPEVVALADADRERGERVAAAGRVRAVYSDWRLMLREVPLDAVLYAASPEIASQEIAEVAIALDTRVRWLWIEGPPALSVTAALQLAQQLQGRHARIWWSRPLRRAVAHRAAWRIIERDEIGIVSALVLRWGAPLHVMPQVMSNEERAHASGSTGGSAGGSTGGHAGGRDGTSHLSSSFAAIDMLLAFGSSSAEGAAVPTQVLASEMNGAANLWARLANGVSATALFSGADSWNAPLPRLEICGTQGRSIVCEAGRRLWLHQPREAACLLEPPGLGAHISMANQVGIAEDLKAFLATCAESETTARVVNSSDDTQKSDALLGVVRVLQLIEAAGESLAAGRCIEIEPIRQEARTAMSRGAPVPQEAPGSTESEKTESANSQPVVPTATLPLQL